MTLVEIGCMEKYVHREHKKPTDAKSILAEFGCKEGESILATKLREMVLAYETEITDGLARNYYHPIKGSLFLQRKQPISSPYFVLHQEGHRRSGQRRQRLDFIWFLEKRAESLAEVRKQNDEYKIVFEYSANQGRIDEETQNESFQSFTGYDAFHLEKISLGPIPMSTFTQREEVAVLPDIHRVRPISYPLTFENIRVFLERALRPAETFAEADAQIDGVWAKHGFPLKDARSLKKAIWEFGNHDYVERDGFRMIGRCLTVPGNFEELLRTRFGIALLRCETSGARIRISAYDAEELAELRAERAATSTHEASIYQKMIIIDWTSRQFDQKRAIPEIIDVTEDSKLRERLEIIERGDL
jgi:hypothetical protein